MNLSYDGRKEIWKEGRIEDKEKRREAGHEPEPCLKLKVALHWLSSLPSPKPLQGGRIREVNQA